MTIFADQLQRALGAGYQLDRELVGGGMSRVFIAQDRALGRRVVVKVLPPELAAGVNRDRFRREIQLAAQLQHPHIVPVLSAGEEGDLLWYTMPFIEGESLRTAIERQQEFSVRDVVRILHDVVDALAYAHERVVVHRDIKPGNILTHGSHGLVTDFGVAKALTAALPSTGLTTAGMAIGTPAYMAPEQLAGDPSTDARVDLYAVGLLAYELLAGTSPFSGATPRETMTAQLTTTPTPLDEVRPDVPHALAAVIARCLAKDPADRPQTAGDVLHVLDSLSMPSSTPSQTTAPARVSSHRTAIFGGVAVLGAIVVAGVIYAATRGTTTDLSKGLTPATDSTHVAARGRATAAANGVVADTGDLITLSPAEIVALVDHELAKRMSAQPAVKQPVADSAFLARHDDSLRAHLRDSLATVFRAAAQRLVRRVYVVDGPPGNWPGGRDLGLAAADSLRRVIAGSKQYRLVPAESLFDTNARGRGRGGPNFSALMPGEIAISVAAEGRSRDSAAFRIGMLIGDTTDAGAAGGRAKRLPMITGPVVLHASTAATLTGVITETMVTLDSLSRSGRGGGRGRVGRFGGPPRG